MQEIAAIKKAYEKNTHFARKVLTETEYMRFESLKGERQMTYLAGRWAAKEAFSKALGTGIGPLSFHDLEILNDDKGAPYFSLSPVSYKVWVSISHSGNFAQASVILEDNDESK